MKMVPKFLKFFCIFLYLIGFCFSSSLFQYGVGHFVQENLYPLQTTDCTGDEVFCEENVACVNKYMFDTYCPGQSGYVCYYPEQRFCFRTTDNCVFTGEDLVADMDCYCPDGLVSCPPYNNTCADSLANCPAEYCSGFLCWDGFTCVDDSSQCEKTCGDTTGIDQVVCNAFIGCVHEVQYGEFCSGSGQCSTGMDYDYCYRAGGCMSPQNISSYCCQGLNNDGPYCYLGCEEDGVCHLLSEGCAADRICDDWNPCHGGGECIDGSCVCDFMWGNTRCQSRYMNIIEKYSSDQMYNPTWDSDPFFFSYEDPGPKAFSEVLMPATFGGGMVAYQKSTDQIPRLRVYGGSVGSLTQDYDYYCNQFQCPGYVPAVFPGYWGLAMNMFQTEYWELELSFEGDNSVFNNSRAYRYHFDSSSYQPRARYLHSVVKRTAGGLNEAVIFGGIAANDNFYDYDDFFASDFTDTPMDDGYIHDLETGGFTPMSSFPQPIWGHSAVYDSVDDVMYIFGGASCLYGTCPTEIYDQLFGTGMEFLGSLWKYEFASDTWSEMSSLSTVSIYEAHYGLNVTPRKYMSSMVIHENRRQIYIYGGASDDIQGNFMNDPDSILFIYDIIGDVWDGFQLDNSVKTLNPHMYITDDDFLVIVPNYCFDASSIDRSRWVKCLVDDRYNQYWSILNLDTLNSYSREFVLDLQFSSAKAIVSPTDFPDWGLDKTTVFSFGGISDNRPKSIFLYHQTCNAGEEVFLDDCSTVMTCQQCPSGYFSEFPLSESCQICMAGTYSNEGTQYCEPCDPGSYSSYDGAWDCNLCSPGTYTSQDSQTECQLCAEGTYSSDYGSTVCEPCEVGSYQDNTGESFCMDCLEGKYQNLQGQIRCLNCPSSGYAEQSGSAECTSCPNNTKVDTDSLSANDTGGRSLQDCMCEENFYTRFDVMDNVGCLECPIGAVCAGGFENPIAAPGYWQSDTDPFSFLVCAPDLCLGGEENFCIAGHEGRLCANCESGWYKSSDSCIECPDNSQLTIVGFFLICIFAALALVVSSGGKSGGGGGAGGALGAFSSFSISFNLFQVMALFSGFDLNWPGPLLRIYEALSALNFNIQVFAPECSVEMTHYDKWQIMIYFPFMFLLLMAVILGMLCGIGYIINQFSSSKDKKKMKKIKKKSGAIELKPLSPQKATFIPSDAAQISPGMAPGMSPGMAPGMSPGMAPGMAPGMSPGMAPGMSPGMAPGMVQPQHYPMGNPGFPQKVIVAPANADVVEPEKSLSFMDKIRTPKVLISIFINATYFFLSICYTLLISKSLEHFYCIEQVDGSSLLAGSPGLSCYDDEWDGFVPIAIAAIVIFGVGIPLLYLCTVIYFRSRLHEPWVQQTFGATFLRYKVRWAWWEVFVFTRKFGIAFSSILPVPLYQTLVGLVVLFFTLQLQVFARPFRRVQHNRLEFVSILTIFTTLFSGLLFLHGLPTETAEQVCTVFVLIILAASAIFVIWGILIEVKTYFLKKKKIDNKVKIAGQAENVLFWLFPHSFNYIKGWQKYKDEDEIDCFNKDCNNIKKLVDEVTSPDDSDDESAEDALEHRLTSYRSKHENLSQSA